MGVLVGVAEEVGIGVAVAVGVYVAVGVGKVWWPNRKFHTVLAAIRKAARFVLRP